MVKLRYVFYLQQVVGVGLMWCSECLQVSIRPGCSAFVNHVLTSYSSLSFAPSAAVVGKDQIHPTQIALAQCQSYVCTSCYFVSLPLLLLFPFYW